MPLISTARALFKASDRGHSLVSSPRAYFPEQRHYTKVRVHAPLSRRERQRFGKLFLRAHPTCADVIFDARFVQPFSGSIAEAPAGRASVAEPAAHTRTSFSISNPTMAPSRTLLLLRKALLLAAIVLACCVAVSVVGPENSTTASSSGTSFNPPEDHRGHQQGLWPGGEGQRRSLVTGGVPGEGLLLVVANSDADAIDEFGDEGIEFPPPEARGWHKKLLPPNK